MQKTSFLFLLLLLGISLIGAYQALTGAPATAATARFLALSAFFLLCVSLMIGPLAVFQPEKFASLIEPRRAVGLAAFFFAALHIVVVISLYFGWDFASVLSFPQLVIAVPAAAILALLALTSCDYAVEKMGMAKWKTLQYLVYPSFILLFIHFMLKSNGLFAKQGAALSLNFSEAALLLFALATIALQVAGFYVRVKRKNAAVFSSEKGKEEG